MNLQKKFEIAVQLLENDIPMQRIRSSTESDLISIATRTNVPEDELRAFAQEVAHRGRHRACANQRLRELRSLRTVLFTDDYWCIPKEMRDHCTFNSPLSSHVQILSQGYQVMFHIHDKTLAERASQVLGRRIEAVNDSLPALPEGYAAIYIPQEQVAELKDNQDLIVREYV